MIGIIDNNDVIYEFYKLIEPDLLDMPKGEEMHRGLSFSHLKL